MMKNKFAAVLAVLATVITARAQNFPFPQHSTLISGSIKPNSVSQASMDNSVSNKWNTWRNNYLKPAGTGKYYVKFDSAGETVSEAHGYGMLLTVLIAGADPNAKTYYDGLYNYYKAHPSVNNSFLMAWKQNSSFQNIEGADSATDGDMDIAYSLLLADKQWGSGGTINYFKAATNIINALMASDVSHSRWNLKLGDWATGTDADNTRPSDFMLEHLDSYKAATGDNNWNNVSTTTYGVINALFSGYSPATGLIPDFVVPNGSGWKPAAANFLEGPHDGEYDYNSCRTPWRFPLDYLFNGDTRALSDMRRINGWIKAKVSSNPASIVDGYHLSGGSYGTGPSGAFFAPFGVCAMIDSTNQSWLNAVWSHTASASTEAYYEDSIKLLSMFCMSGNYWTPQSVAPAPNFTQSTTPSSQTVFRGDSTTYTTTVTAQNGFSGTVSFSVTGVPSGATATFSPTTVAGAGSTTLTIDTPTTIASGTYTLLIKGTSGSLARSNSVTLVVSDFSVTLTPTTATVVQGDSASYTVNVGTVNGFAGSVSLAASGIPTDATGSFSPATVTAPGTSTLTVSTASTTPTGTSTITVTGTSGAISHSDSSTLTVNAPSGGPLPSGWTDTDVGAVGVAGSASYDSGTGTFTLNGSGSDIWSTADSFNYASESASGDITVIARVVSQDHTAAWAKGGVMVRESTAANAAYVGVYVTPSNGVSMQIRTATGVTAIDMGRQAGPVAPYWVKIVRSGNTFTGSSSADGSTWTTVAATNIAMVTAVLAGLADCAHANTILNTSTFDNVSVGTTAPPPDFSLSASPASVTVTQGSSGTSTISVTGVNGFSGSVSLSASGLPAGVTASFSPSSTTTTSTLTLTASSTATTGTATVTITGTSGSLTHTTPVTLTVNPNNTGTLLFEAEDINYVTNGATATLNNDTNASGAQWILFNGTAAGQYIEYTLAGVPAGTYDLKLLYKQNTTRGIVSLTIDGVKLDGDLDQYGASAYTQKDFGLITFATTGNHAVRLTLTGKNASSTGFTSSADAFQLTPASQSWLDADIGAVGMAGSFSQSGGTYTVAGSGSDIWTTGDQFHYAWQNVSGDIDVIARVVSEQQTSSFAKAGVMIRESLATNSIEASVLLTPTNGVAMQVRTATGGSSINVSGWVKGPVAPQWVKLSRAGNTFSASYSADGATWTSLASTNVTMHVGATAGMAVTSHNNAAVNTATFDNVSVQ